MKAVKMLVALMLVSAIVVKAGDEHGVKVLTAKMDVVYLKVASDLIGGVLTVVDTTGTTLIKMTIENKKVLVDFFQEKPGDYVIHIERCDHIEELAYHKV